MTNEDKPWIGIDLDGTLAEYHGWVNELHIGKPIPAMVNRLETFLAEGKRVKIFTARVHESPLEPDRSVGMIRAAIWQWLERHVRGWELIDEITCEKDYKCVEIWDDRCVQVEPNTGRMLASEPSFPYWETGEL